MIKIRHKETGAEVSLPDGRLSVGWWQSDVKMVSYPASEWDEVKDEEK